MNEALRNQLPKFVHERWGEASSKTQEIPKEVIASLTETEIPKASLFTHYDEHASVTDFKHAISVAQSAEEEGKVIGWFLSQVGQEYLKHVFLSFLYGNHPRTQKVRRQIEHALRVRYRLRPANTSPEGLVNLVVIDMITHKDSLVPELKRALKSAVLGYEVELENDREDVEKKLMPEFKESFLKDMNVWFRKKIICGIDSVWLAEKIDRLRGGVFIPDEAFAKRSVAGFFDQKDREVYFNKVPTKKQRERVFRHEVFHYVSFGDRQGLRFDGGYKWLDEAITESLTCAQVSGLYDDAVTPSTVLSYGAEREEGSYPEYREILKNLLTTLKRKQVTSPALQEKIPLEQLFLNAYILDNKEKKTLHWERCVRQVNALMGRKDFLRSFDKLVQWCDPLETESGVIDLTAPPTSIGKIKLRPDALAIALAEEPTDRLFWLCEVAAVCKNMVCEDEADIVLRNGKLKKLFDGQGFTTAADFFQESSLFLLQEVS